MPNIFDRQLSTDYSKPKDTSGENDPTNYTIQSLPEPDVGDEMSIDESDTAAANPQSAVEAQYEARRRGGTRMPRPRPRIPSPKRPRRPKL